MYRKTCVQRPLSKDRKLVFKTDYRLMQAKSILQYFRPSLRCHLSLRPLFCLFLSGRFTQVLLYSACFELLNIYGLGCEATGNTVNFA